MASQTELLSAARRLMRRRGAAFGMAELAAEAGVSRATLYRTFSSREALLKALHGAGVRVEPVASPEDRAVRAVEKVLLRDGFAGFTMEAVAREAGLSLATVYRSFGDREGLLRAFVQERSPRPALLGLLDRPVATSAELESVLVTFTEQTLEALEASRALFQLAFAAPDEVRELLGRVRDAPRGVTAALARFLSVQMEAGRLRRLDAHVLASAFAGQLVALAIVLPGAGEALPPRPALTVKLVQAFLHGALP